GPAPASSLPGEVRRRDVCSGVGHDCRWSRAAPPGFVAHLTLSPGFRNLGRRRDLIRAGPVCSQAEQALVMSAQLRLREMSSNVVYAIVKAGGRQEKVSVGDVVVVDRLSGDAGDTVELPALLLVDGEK